ncbi:MAG: twin-arginine translocase subunit TatC [Haloarculaceae archaeon]
MSDGESGLYSEMDVEGPEPPATNQTPGAPDDEEMPLADHVEEMVRRVGVVVLSMTVVAALAFPFADRLINFLWFSFLPGIASQCPPAGSAVASGAGGTAAATGPNGAACPRLYHPLALMLARLKVSTLAGFIVALPVFVYETYLFMRPGLYPRERKYYLAAVPTSIVLAAVGVSVAFLLVLPAIFTYFLYYSQSAAVIAFGLTDTFNLMVMMLGLFAFIFQIPLFVMLAIMMGITTRRWLAARRLYFWGGFLTIAFFFSPDPTGMAPIIVALSMVTLFESTLLLLRWTGGGSLAPSPESVAAARPGAWILAAAVGYVASTAPVPGGYFGALPGWFVDALATRRLLALTPVVVGAVVLLAYELVVYLLARLGRFRARTALTRVRLPVWLLAVVVGYFASPDPRLLEGARAIALAPAEAAAIAVGVIALYEAALFAYRWVTPDEPGPNQPPPPPPQ